MKKILLSVGVLFLPFVAFAQDTGNNTSNGVTSSLNNTLNGTGGLIATLTNAVNSVIPFLLALAVVVFIWGVIRYVISPSAEEKANARGYIIYGIIGIVIIVSIFGLVRLVQSVFGIGGASLGISDIPQVPSSYSGSGLNNQLDPGGELNAGGSDQNGFGQNCLTDSNCSGGLVCKQGECSN